MERHLIFYTLFGCILSAVIFVALFLSHYANKAFEPFPFLFPSMFRVRKRKLWCFDLDITLASQKRQIYSACEWTIWTMIVTLACFFWQTAILQMMTFRNTVDVHAKVSLLCERRFDCYVHSSLTDVSYFWNHNSVLWACDLPASELVDLGRWITCCGFLPFDLINAISQLALTTALQLLFAVMFQGLTRILYLSRRKWPLYVVLFSAITVFLLIIVAQLLGRTSHMVAIVCFGFPIIILCAYVAGSALQDLREKRIQVYAKAINQEPIETLEDEEEVLAQAAVVRLCEGTCLVSPLFAGSTNSQDGDDVEFSSRQDTEDPGETTRLKRFKAAARKRLQRNNKS